MVDPMLIISLIVLIMSFLGLSWFAGSDAPYIPTQVRKIKSLLTLAGVKKNKVFYELGSGDGRVVIEAAKLKAISFGIEQSWLRVWLSRAKASSLNLKNAQFFHGNIFDRNFYPADIVYIYLLQKAVDRLEKKLKKELKKGAVVITQTYHFKSWKPYKKINQFWMYRV
ncbi:hypothetical protein HY025_01550 [Candidatus Daviesbacteria bacterium]|nr:hypothetical protein [Candidatus Daviesbacteria bacterium]